MLQDEKISAVRKSRDGRRVIHDRLFVPLNSQTFDWYKKGLKRWELRGASGQYNRRYIKKNRLVELRKGYNGNSIWGKVGRNCEGRSLDELFGVVDFREVIPVASNVREAKEIANSIMGNKEKYILIEILL